MKRPRLLFLASREPSYSRVDIVQRALASRFEVISIVSSAQSYPRRFAQVLWALTQTPADRYDVVFLGFFAQPIFPFVRLLTRKPIISDLYFSIYDTFITDKKLAARKHPLGKLCLWLDRDTLRHSRLLFSDTAGTAEYLASLMPPPARPITRLWISAQPEIFRPLPLLDAPGAGEKFRLLFYGGFIPLQGVEIIIRAAALLRDEPVHFDIVGTGQTFAQSRELDTQLGNGNTTFHGWKSQNDVLELAVGSHVVLGIFGATEKAQRVIPNKVYEGLAMAKPVLTGETPAIRELLTPGHDVVTCAMADADALAAAIRWSLQHYADLRRIAVNGHQTFAGKASPTVVADVLEHAITREFSAPDS